MAHKILQHDSGVTPTDEAADKQYLKDSDSTPEQRSDRNDMLAHLYPQGTPREKDYKRYADIDLASAKITRRPDMSQDIKWNKVVQTGLILPLPFFALDMFFVLFIGQMPDLVKNASVAMMGIPYVMFVVITMFVMKRYFDTKINQIGLNAFPLFWASLFFALPFVQVLRLVLVPSLLDGVAPPVTNAVAYCLATVSIVAVTLSAVTYIYYRINKSQEVRVRILCAAASIPYVIGAPLLLFAIIQLFRP